MDFLRIVAMMDIQPMPDVQIHPDGYVVDRAGDVIKKAICPIVPRISKHLFAGLEPGMVYRYAEAFGIVNLATRDQHENFIEMLAQFSGYERAGITPNSGINWYTQGAIACDRGVFHELITALDPKLTFGPVVCAKLANDFQAFKKKAQAWDTNLDLNGGFYNQYLAWYTVLDMAANNGMVTVY